MKPSTPINGSIAKERIAFLLMTPQPFESLRSFYSRLATQADQAYLIRADGTSYKDDWIQGRLLQVIQDQKLSTAIASVDHDQLENVLAKNEIMEKVIIKPLPWLYNLYNIPPSIPDHPHPALCLPIRIPGGSLRRVPSRPSNARTDPLLSGRRKQRDN